MSNPANVSLILNGESGFWEGTLGEEAGVPGGWGLGSAARLHPTHVEVVLGGGGTLLGSGRSWVASEGLWFWIGD